MILFAALPAGAIDGPVDPGTASSYGVLGAVSITNTGPTTIAGDLGLSPGDPASISGLADVTLSGAVHAADPAALQAQTDLDTAYTTAAGFVSTPLASPDLAELRLAPGVYSSAISMLLNGNLILDGGGDPNAVWVFQSGAELDTATGSTITLAGDANACNVFWQVGSSATLGVGSAFVGTIMAQQSIAAKTDATVQGRLLAETGSVTLDSNVITPPTNCAPPGTTVDTGGPGGAAETDPFGSLPTLAFTGANPTPLVAGGSVLIALGVAASVVGLRPRPGHGRRRLSAD